MPAVIQGYTQTSEVRGGNKVVPVREYHVISNPSETYFQFRRDKAHYSGAKSSAAQFSQRIEAVLADPRVTDVVYSQNTTPGGKLVDWMTTYYSTPDGEISGFVESDLAHFGPKTTLPQIAEEIAAGGDQLG